MTGPMETLSQAMGRFEDAGYTGQYIVASGVLECSRCGEGVAPEDLVVDDIFRSEGMSDPDDESVLFAVRGPCGHRGTLVATYGPDTPPDEVEVLLRLPRRAR